MAKAVKMGGKEGENVVGQFECSDISATENGRWLVLAGIHLMCNRNGSE